MKSKMILSTLTFFLLALVVQVSASSGTENDQQRTIKSAVEAARKIVGTDHKGIPADLLFNARGLAIVPALSTDHQSGGETTGVVFTHDRVRGWSYPVFTSVREDIANLRFGGKAPTLILLLNHYGIVNKLDFGEFVIDEGSAKPGSMKTMPGMTRSGAENARRPDVYSYNLEQGELSGMSFKDIVVVMQIDQKATVDYYSVCRQEQIVPIQILTGQSVCGPSEATELKNILNAYTSKLR